MNKDLTSLLKGCRPFKDESGNVVVQSIANMQVVCLTTDDEFSINKFANPMEVLASNKRYGHMQLRNPSDKPMIVPAQIAVLNNAQAQNHGMVKAAYIPIGASNEFDDAGCIQGGQHGTINEGHGNVVRFIPFGAKEYIFEKVNRIDGHDNIYAAIDQVGKETGANSGTYLDKYFEKYDRKLSEFIAHFERPSKTIGAIVFVDGEIVAIDKFPSFEYCGQVWDALIRDCYGSIAITEEVRGGKAEKPFTENLKVSVKLTGDMSVGMRLRKAYDRTRSQLTDRVRERVEEILCVEFAATKDRDQGGYKSEIIKTDGYIGQVISEGNTGDYNHIVSVVKKRMFIPERFRKANEMSKLAKKQDRFKI